MLRSVALASASDNSMGRKSDTCAVGLHLLRIKNFISENAESRYMLKKSVQQDTFMDSGTVLLKH